MIQRESREKHFKSPQHLLKFRVDYLYIWISRNQFTTKQQSSKTTQNTHSIKEQGFLDLIISEFNFLKQRSMETFKLALALLVVAGLQQIKVESATTFTLKKTAGQLLDETFLLLRRDFQRLDNVDNDLKMKVAKLSEDIKTLKIIHGKCAPCQAVQGTDKYCDCTNYPPKKDCLEFHQTGFKVSKQIL